MASRITGVELRGEGAGRTYCAVGRSWIMVSEIRVWEGREERTYVSLRGRAERLANSTSYSGRAVCKLVVRRAIEGTKGGGDVERMRTEETHAYLSIKLSVLRFVTLVYLSILCLWLLLSLSFLEIKCVAQQQIFRQENPVFAKPLCNCLFGSTFS